jgi:predicted dithiol-disulfide oxidoreductase (DUF899 family)
LRDRLNAERLALPWVEVEKQYEFDTDAGRRSLADLFAGRSQLMIYHFMLGPGWAAGCSDFNFDYRVSFSERELQAATLDYNFTEAPMPEGFNDTELPGLSAFYRDQAGGVFHTYSSYARGPEELIGALMILDRAPKGRNEKSTMDFVRRHDEYLDAPGAHACHAVQT